MDESGGARPDPATGGPTTGAVSRRRFLGWLGVAGVGAGAAGAGIAARVVETDGATPSSPEDVVPFHGAHQAGITTPSQTHLLFASLDVTEPSRDTLRGLLRYWTGAAARMTLGAGVTRDRDAGGIQWDTGEAVGLRPSRLTVTFGVGPSLFSRGGVDRFGLASRRPDALVDLPEFDGDELDPSFTGGDLCIQACADDEQVAVHAVRELVRLGHGLVAVRWAQAGFLPRAVAGATPRNLLGFMDGTNNITGREELDRFVWVGDEGAAWLRGGTYLVARRIEMRIDHWDASPLHEQETVIGRRKATGAPLSGGDEHTPLDLSAVGADGSPSIPADAHVRLAAPESNDGQRILRRPYSFVDRTGGQGNLTAGLFFLAFQRDPRTQFIPIQTRLAREDALGEYVRHTGSAIFVMFPGVRPRGSFGGGLL